MSILTSLFTDGASKIVDSVGTAIDNLVTNDEERESLKNELYKIQADKALEFEKLAITRENEITQRLKADMGSDSWLSKNIRPLTLIFILVMYSLLSISSGFEFKVTQAYIELLGEWGMLIMSFYFGGRTVEKVINSINGGKK